MTYDQILSDLKAKKYSPLYLLHGDEIYYLDKIADWIENNVLNEAEKAFNLTVFYGKDIDHKTLIEEARQFPLMAEKRLIIVKEAQEMKTLKELTDYAKKPVPHAIVVLVHKYKSLDKRLTVTKALSEHVVFESKKLYDNQLPAWIAQYSKQKQLNISDHLCGLLAEYLGNDLTKIANEIDKLALSNGPGAKITPEIVQDQIGISKEFNVFELQKAIAEKNKAKIFLIAKYFADNPKDNPIQVTVVNLFNYFSKVMITGQHASESDVSLQKKLGLPSPFFVKEYRQAAKNFSVERSREIILDIHETDLESKGVMNKNKTDGQLLMELLYKIVA